MFLLTFINLFFVSALENQKLHEKKNKEGKRRHECTNQDEETQRYPAPKNNMAQI